MSTRTKIIVGVVGGVVILAAAYLLFFNSNSNTSAVSNGSAPASAAEVAFLNLASKTGPITFDTSIFSDPRFTSLVDIHTVIIPEPQGRTDPFASVPGITASGN